MGGGGSKPSAPPPPVEVNLPNPGDVASLTNLSLAPGTTATCDGCAISVDASVSTSSVKLTREFGSITREQCDRYQKDWKLVNDKQMSFSDFIGNLQAGKYSNPASTTSEGTWCQEFRLPDDVAEKLKNLNDYNREIVNNIQVTRIRKVSGAGGFSSSTKAKIKLSLPVKFVYVDGNEPGSAASTSMRQVGGVWSWVTSPTPRQMVPVYKSSNISMMTIYHPSPIRIENVQHDAVLSLNDPSDPNADVVILVPLKSSNTNNAATEFFGKFIKYVTAIASPDPATGQYPETDIPTGSGWNIKSLFWLGDVDKSNNLSPVTNAFFSWKGAATYVPSQIRSGNQIINGWKSDGKEVRYFMLEEPVSIAPMDLSFLTRSLPTTPPEEAIHRIPDPTVTKTKVLYKQATPPASTAECSGTVREHLENPGPGDVLGSIFSGGSQDMLVDDSGNPLSESCDPFANNAKRNIRTNSWFTPTRFFTLFFNILLIVAAAFGTWLALYFIANKDYDNTYREFSETAGKVVGKLALQSSGRLQEATAGIGQGVSGLKSLVSLPSQAPAALNEVDAEKALGPLKGLSKLGSLFGKK